jgi:hypothetical protein
MLLSIVLALCLADAYTIGPAQRVCLHPLHKPLLLRGGNASHDRKKEMGEEEDLGIDSLLDDPAGFYPPADETTTEIFRRIDAKGFVNLSLCPRYMTPKHSGNILIVPISSEPSRIIS